MSSYPGAHQILSRDEHLLVACKPHFLPVVPGGRFVRECLLYKLMEETALRWLSGPPSEDGPPPLLSKSFRFRDPFTQEERAFTSLRELIPLPGE